jgi:guanosine-3',5'-bis(diphosphate) 3'-pyrophosphohydrolase
MQAEILEAIIKFTDHSHGEQKRKYTDERYIVHPIRVMQTCQQYTHDVAVLAAALMHDLLEDTPVTEDQIRNFLSPLLSKGDVHRAIGYVVELTDVFIKKDFPRLNRRSRKQKEVDRLSKTSYEAQTIKYADLIDNVVDIVKHDADFGYRYIQEGQALLDKMNKGHAVLYQRAVHTLSECLDKVKKLPESK